MQIDRYNHLQFPRNNTPSALDSDVSDAAPRAGLTKPQGGVPAPAAQGARLRAESVVLKVQFPGAGVSPQDRAEGNFYTDGRKAIGAGGAPIDSDSQAAEHQRAVDRNAGVFTQITLNKDGVLVAKPQPVAEARQPDFVALAVSAMREFRDEAERQKAHSSSSEPASGEMPWGRLKSLQQLAAKFNVFA